MKTFIKDQFYHDLERLKPLAYESFLIHVTVLPQEGKEIYLNIVTDRNEVIDDITLKIGNETGLTRQQINSLTITGCQPPKSLTAAQLAALLDGNDRRNEISRSLQQEAQKNNLLVLFGASDDLLKFRGVLQNIVGAFDGITVYLTKKLNIKKKHKPNRLKIEAVYSENESGPAWIINTDTRSYPFEIYEEEEIFCIGAVIDLDEVQVWKKKKS